MAIQFNLMNPGSSIIKVMGIGGGGGNAVNSMFRRGIKGVDFVVCNTDMQVLEKSPVPTKIRLGASLTQGLGCGAKPEIGRDSALESIEEVRDLLKDHTRMVFITAGMGGGTGTGAAPVIAKLAKDMGILTVGIVTTPFKFEGDWRMNIAQQGVKELESCVDTLLVIKNANLMQICAKNIRQRDAYLKADEVLSNAAKGIAEIITMDGHMNVDFADVNTIMRDSGSALMGSATFAGENRAQLAVEEALDSPLLDQMDIHGATGILVNITASEETLTMGEIELIGNHVEQAAGGNAKIIFGQVFTDDAADALSVTVIATGFHKKEKPAIQPNAQQQPSAAPKKNGMGKPVQAALPLQEVDERRAQALAEEARKEAARAARQLSLQERMQRVQTLDYDLHNPSKLKHLEDEPAYVRRRISLEPDSAAGRGALSRLSLEADSQGKYQLRENNAFLFDNVD